MGDLMPPGKRQEFVAPFPRRLQEADPDLVDAEGVGGQRPRRLLRGENLGPLSGFAGGDHRISAGIGQEPHTPGSAASIDVGDQARPLQVGERLLGAARAAIRVVDRRVHDVLLD